MSELSIADALTLATKLQAVSDTARLDLELLLCHVLGQSRSYLFTWPERQLNTEQQAQFLDLLKEREHGRPIAHILGHRGFWSLELEVNDSTLIPRPDTEILVEAALDKCFSDASVLDLGTGTGAIALAIASERLDIEVQAIDFSNSAIALAERNRLKNGINNTRMYQSSWFDAVSGCFDLIVSNPPYIEADDPHLSQGDVRFEPRSALVSGKDGLDDIRQICLQSPSYLFEGGWLMLEHGWHQADSVSALFHAARFSQVETLKDIAGNDRITIGQWLGD